MNCEADIAAQMMTNQHSHLRQQTEFTERDDGEYSPSLAVRQREEARGE
jgi:hypothetical protein